VVNSKADRTAYVLNIKITLVTASITTGAYTDQLSVEMPILGDWLRYALFQEEPKRAASQQQTEYRNERDSQVQKAWRQIESQAAQRAPTFDVAAERP
jgi:hypothetical protein